MNVSAFQDAYLRRIETIIQPEEINSNVANALRFVVQHVFANITNAFVITISSDKGPIEFWLHDLMGKLFLTWSFIAVQLVVLDHKTERLVVPGERYCNLIMIDSYESLEKADLAEYNRNSDGLEYYFIFLQIPDNVAVNEMQRIFKYCFDNYWIHCNIMVQNLYGELLIYTYFPFVEHNCFQTEPTLINQFKSGRFVNNIMFPDKLRDFQRCPLKLSTWETPPFVINATNKKYPNISVSGFEIVTMIAISQHMNFSLDIDWISSDTYHKNKTNEPGPLTKLKRLQTNITMGYFRRTAGTDKIATPTYVTYYIPIAAINIRKQVQHISMSILTFPFDKTTWILMITFYGLLAGINCFKNRRIKVPSFQIFEIIIGMPTTKVPRRSSKRIHFTTVLLSSFILRSIYESLLFLLFRTNFYQAAPITLNALVTAGYKAVSTELTKEFLLYVPEIEDKSLPLITINTTDEIYPLSYMDRYRNESLVAMSIVEFAIRYVREQMTVGEALQILAINVKDQQIGFYLSKHSYLSRRFDYYILHFHQAGLLNKWREWTNLYYQVTTKRSSTVYEDALMII
ncbi:uncharacterized protein LOC135958347 [Calliphora vicina]|uniref:uncharacterized protein LOC135958347 n=1 Tax=Calliphora vicina TaxID=7373 RepID=UPI00325B4948